MSIIFLSGKVVCKKKNPGREVLSRRRKESSTRTSNSRPAGLNGIDSGSSRAVLQDDPEIGELCVQAMELGQEGLLERKVLGGGDAGHLSVQVEDHVMALHLGKHGREGLEEIGAGASLGVGRHALRIHLDARDASGGGFGDDGGGH